MEPWIPVVLAVVGSGGVLTLVLNGIGKWFVRRHDARLADKLADLKKIDELQKQIFTMQQERIADEIKRRQETDKSTTLLLEMAALLKSSKGATP